MRRYAFPLLLLLACRDNLYVDPVCEGVLCTAGTCFDDDGRPACYCDAFDEASGQVCLIIRERSAESAIELTPGVPLTTTLVVDPTGPDLDWYRFHAVSGHAYSVSCAPVETDEAKPLDRCSIDPGFYEPVAGAPEERFYGPVPESGPIVFSVFGAGRHGSYTIRVVDTEDDHGAGHSPTQLAPGQSVSGTLHHAYDVDVFSFTAEAYGAYRVEVELTSPGAAGVKLPTADKYSPANRFLAYGATGSAATTFKVAVGGALYVTVSRSSTSSSALPSYVVRLSKLEDDHGDSPQAASPIVADVPVEGELIDGDKDVFSFTAQEGYAYAPRCSGCTALIRNATGGSVEPAFIGGAQWKLTGEATYLVEVVENEYEPITTLPYVFVLESIGPDDHGDTAELATRIGLGTTAGVFEIRGDRDAFVSALRANTYYRLEYPFDVGNYQAPRAATLTGHFGEVSYGKYELEPSVDSDVRFIATGLEGAYNLSLIETGVDDHGDTLNDATPLAVGETATGVLARRWDADSFAIEVFGGVTRVLERTFPSGVAVRILDASGASPAVGLDGSFTPAATGTLEVRVGFAYTGTDFVRDAPYSFTVK